MNKLIILLLLVACNKEGPKEDIWYAPYGQRLVFVNQELRYYRSNPKCQLSGPYHTFESGNIAWELKQTCFNDQPFTAYCYLWRDIDRDGISFVELACQEMGIHAIFRK